MVAQQFEMGLRMQAGRANIRPRLDLIQVTRVDTTPGDYTIALDHLPCLEVRGQLSIAFFVLFLSHANCPEDHSNRRFETP